MNQGSRRAKRWLKAGLTAALVWGLCGCSASSPADSAQVSIAEESSAAPLIEITSDEEKETKAPAEQTGSRSFLTGLPIEEDKAGRRPLALMISNDRAALPQYGIETAQVVYEAPVEGGMNRFMAIFEDYDEFEQMGPVRSCRTYYVYLAKEYDAVYAHFGQSTFAKPYLNEIDNINGIEGTGSQAYYRTRDRKSPHNAFTGGARLNQAINALGYRTERDSSADGHFLFADEAEPETLENRPAVIAAEAVRPGYPLNQPEFRYSSEDGLYHRSQYGKTHMGSTGPVEVKNLIIQYCAVGHYATTEYLDINVNASDWGYFVTEGHAIPVTWEKKNGITRYYDQDHEEIRLNPGRTWICIVPSKDYQKTEFEPGA